MVAVRDLLRQPDPTAEPDHRTRVPRGGDHTDWARAWDGLGGGGRLGQQRRRQRPSSAGEPRPTADAVWAVTRAPGPEPTGRTRSDPQTARVSTTRPSAVRTSTVVMSVRPAAVAPVSRMVRPGSAFQVATCSTPPARVCTTRA